MVAVCFKKLCYNQLIGLEDFVQGFMHSFLFVLYSVVENDIEPRFTNIKLRDGVVLDDLQNEIIRPVECCLEGLVLNLGCFVNFF